MAGELYSQEHFKRHPQARGLLRYEGDDATEAGFFVEHMAKRKAEHKHKDKAEHKTKHEADHKVDTECNKILGKYNAKQAFEQIAWLPLGSYYYI